MAKRVKRKTKTRSRAHKKWVSGKRTRRVKARSKVGYGARRRRQKKKSAKK
jgi:hypothetical protein